MFKLNCKKLSHPFVVACMLMTTACDASTTEFQDKAAIKGFIQEMVKEHKFQSAELETIFAQAKRRQSILDAISRPAEAKPWYEYRPIFITDSRIEGGIKFWNDNAITLKRASEKFGVPAEIITAIIGVETRYGRHKGSFPLIDSLSTLAFAYPPRSRFFRSELKHFLLMTREEKMDPVSQTGSYAGAMGMPQFISSSFRSYAIDFDGDGKKDLWNNADDAIGSVANYFKRHGWKEGDLITHQVSTKGKKYKTYANQSLKPSLNVAELRKHGVLLNKTFNATRMGALIELDKNEKEKEYWVGWDNFYVITRYNHSALYAMAVFQLAEQIKAKR